MSGELPEESSDSGLGEIKSIQCRSLTSSSEGVDLSVRALFFALVS
jgi:hypothetical protein